MPSTALADTLEAISMGENKGDKKTKDKTKKKKDMQRKENKGHAQPLEGRDCSPILSPN